MQYIQYKIYTQGLTIQVHISISADCSQRCLKTIVTDENKSTKETDFDRFSSVVNDRS